MFIRAQEYCNNYSNTLPCVSRSNGDTDSEDECFDTSDEEYLERCFEEVEPQREPTTGSSAITPYPVTARTPYPVTAVTPYPVTAVTPYPVTAVTPYPVTAITD